MYVLSVAAALAVGGLLAIQASVNQQLNKSVGTPFGASTVQLSLAVLVLAVLAGATGTLGRLAVLPEVDPVWLLLGGLASPLYITAGILLFPRVGAVTAVGLFVTGQVMSSLLLDGYGWLGVHREPFSAGPAVGAFAVLAGITVVVWAQHLATRRTAAPVKVGMRGVEVAATPIPMAPLPEPKRGTASPSLAGWVVLGLVAGAVLPFQGAINAQLQHQVGAPFAVATVSFVVATLAIAAVLVVLMALRRTRTPRFRPLASMPWWGWLGGFCAAAYVIASFLLIPAIGAAVTVALTVAGQQLVSAAIDQYGWLGMPRRPLTRIRGFGLMLLLVGSVLVQLA